MFRFQENPQNFKMMADFGKLPIKFQEGIRRGAYISGKLLVKDLRDNLTKKGRSGRLYKIYRGLGGNLLKSPRLHQASSPSEYPAVISGKYRKSVDFVVRGTKSLEFGSGRDGLAANYAKVLELGSSRMKARQPLGKTVKKLGNKVNTILKTEIKKSASKRNS